MFINILNYIITDIRIDIEDGVQKKVTVTNENTNNKNMND